MTVVLMTTNVRKIQEFRAFLGRHAQSLLVEQPTEASEILTTWLQTARAVLMDESNLFTPAGDLVATDYTGPARNICRLHAWVLKDGNLVRMSYIREVAGHFDGTKLQSYNAAVFGWDAAFTPIEGVSLHDMAMMGLKNSAREQCLSAFAKAFLYNKEPKVLRWQKSEATPVVDWNMDANLLLQHPLFQNLEVVAERPLNFVINRGLTFRAATSRRDGNYWAPGLNGGIPNVPKDDPVHEGAYRFHDLMHQLMPDLIFDGVDSPEHRRAYIAHRMMSEAVSLVLADMLFVDSLAKSGDYPGYDFTARRIHPLFEAMQAAQYRDLDQLLFLMTRFVLLGDKTRMPTHTEAWKRFEEKYTRFFVGDFQWTRMNWNNLVARGDTMRRWIDLVRPETLLSQGLRLVSDVVEDIERDLPDEAFVDKLFEQVLRTCINPAYYGYERVDLERSTSNGFRRWLTGQCAFFAHYEPIVGMPPLAHVFAKRLRDATRFSAEERQRIRDQFRTHVQSLAAKGIISDDDATIFPDLFPLFDPFFLKDYDRSKQEFETIEAASKAAFG